MEKARNRRLVRRAVMALAVVVLLLATYIGGWPGLAWLEGRGWITSSTYSSVTETLYVPLFRRIAGDLPIDEVEEWRTWANRNGHLARIRAETEWALEKRSYDAEN